MSRKDFKKWLERNGLNEVDVASMLKIHPITVTRFLNGDKVRRSTQHMFESLVDRMPIKAEAS